MVSPPPQLALCAPRPALPGPAGARGDPGASATAATAHLLTGGAWQAALTHLAALPPSDPSRNAAAQPLAQALPPRGTTGRCAPLLCAVASLGRTPLGDGLAQLACPQGEVVAALLSREVVGGGVPGVSDDGAVPVVEGTVLLLRGAPVLLPAAEPRAAALLLSPGDVVAAWPPQPPPLALPAAPQPRTTLPALPVLLAAPQSGPVPAPVPAPVQPAAWLSAPVGSGRVLAPADDLSALAPLSDSDDLL